MRGAAVVGLGVAVYPPRPARVCGRHNAAAIAPLLPPPSEGVGVPAPASAGTYKARALYPTRFARLVRGVGARIISEGLHPSTPRLLCRRWRGLRPTKPPPTKEGFFVAPSAVVGRPSVVILTTVVDRSGGCAHTLHL